MDGSPQIAPLNGQTPSAPLLRPFAITFFPNAEAEICTEERLTLDELANRIRTTTARAKANLPWLKLARFGTTRTAKDSLRHNANVLAITGIEADYDGEAMSFEEAHEILLKADVLALLYTSPSFTEDTPRWRVLCPTSRELPPEARAALLGRLNGLFRGIFSNESWTLSQAYYYGAVASLVSHRVAIIDGQPIDLLDELDTTWQGKANTVGAKPAVAPGQQILAGRLDVAAVLRDITTGSNYHEATVRLAGRWAYEGIAKAVVKELLVAGMTAVPPDERDHRWKTRYADIERCVKDIYRKHGGRKPAEVEWLAECQMNSRNEPRPNLANALLGLRKAPELQDLLAYDEMLRAPLLLRPVPGLDASGLHPRPLRDTDVSAV